MAPGMVVVKSSYVTANCLLVWDCLVTLPACDDRLPYILHVTVSVNIWGLISMTVVPRWICCTPSNHWASEIAACNRVGMFESSMKRICNSWK